MSPNGSAGSDLPLPRLNEAGLPPAGDGRPPAAPTPHGPAELGPVFDVPVTLSAVLGTSRLPIGDLLTLGPGTVLELDRKVGEAIDLLVNDRLVARGEVVLVDDRLGVTMTEIVRPL